MCGRERARLTTREHRGEERRAWALREAGTGGLRRPIPMPHQPGRHAQAREWRASAWTSTWMRRRNRKRRRAPSRSQISVRRSHVEPERTDVWHCGLRHQCSLMRACARAQAPITCTIRRARCARSSRRQLTARRPWVPCCRRASRSSTSRSALREQKVARRRAAARRKGEEEGRARARAGRREG